MFESKGLKDRGGVEMIGAFAFRRVLLALLAVLVLGGAYVARASAETYTNPGPMPPKEPACTGSGFGYELTPCAATGTICSHIVAPAFAVTGQVVIARTNPPTPCNAWTYDEIPGVQLSPCYIPAESVGYHIEEYGGVGLNECKFEVRPTSEAWHENAKGEWEHTSGPGWVKVGIDLICGYGCETYETRDETWMAVQPAPTPPEEPKKTGTTHPRPGLEVTYGTSPERVLVPQTAKGAEPQTVKFTVHIKNTASTAIQNLSVKDPLHITPVGHLPHATDVSGCTWAQGTPFGKPLSPPAGKTITSPPCPLSEAEPPPHLNLGTLSPGQSANATFTLKVAGDGDYTLYPEIYGEREAETNGEPTEDPVNYIGKYEFKPETQLLMFSASLGAKVRSQENPKLIQAGTHYLINIHLENRSSYQQLQVDPIEPELKGNAMGGQLAAAGTSTKIKPSGSLEQLTVPPVLKLEPGEARNYVLVVNTEGADTFANQTENTGNGTRSTVIFSPPKIATVNEEKPTPAEEDQVVMAPESTEFHVGIDQSKPAPPPFTYTEAAWYFGKGLVWGVWGATYGLVHGAFDLANLGVKTVLGVPSASLNEINYLVELWYATANEPGAHQALVETAVRKVESAYEETPYLISEGKEKLEQKVGEAIDAYFTKIANAWIAGDWREALQDVTETGTNVAATAVGPAALKVASGALGRLSVVADAWDAAKASKFAQITTDLKVGLAAKFEAANNALAELKKVLPGYRFTVPELKTFFGVSAKEANWLSDFTKAKKISVVFRSRAEESLAWLDKGAMLKPYWVKAKNVSWLDVQWLGYRDADVGRVVMREVPDWAAVDAKLAASGVTKGSPEYEEVLDRWQTRSKDYAKELKEMEGWNHQHDIKGKWPWQENGVNPNVQADEYLDYKFRLSKDTHEAGTLVPEIFNPKTRKWGSITGDIDLIAITKADGTALSDVEHVQILKELANSPFGSQHPESLTWTKGSDFWFDKKKSYLVDEDLVQAGPDGVFRSVKFNEKLSEPEKWTKLNYRVFWNGGYEVGPGQVH